MKSKGHYFYNAIIFVMLWLAVDEITISMILLPITISAFPDVDLHFNSHRNFLFHSVLIWLILCFYNFTIISVLSMFSIGLHCLFDVRLKRKKWRGFYSLKIWANKPFWFFLKKKRGTMSTIWYLMNFVISGLVLIYILI